MKAKKILAMMGCVVMMTVNGVPYVGGSVAAAEETDGVTLSEYSGEEKQLWKFETADDSVAPTFRLMNVETRCYLTGSSDGVCTEIMDEQDPPLVFDVLKAGGTEKEPLYELSSDAGSLSFNGTTLSIGTEVSKFKLLSFADGSATDLQLSGTYALCCADSSKVITDNSDDYVYISREATESSQAAVQKWHIDFNRTINGIDYYTFVNIESNHYFSADSSGSRLVTSKDDVSALWSVRRISPYDVPAEFRMPYDIGYYYRLVNAAGSTLYLDGATCEFAAAQQVPYGPSSTFIFEDGIEFLNSGTVHISNVGGRGGENDVYDTACKRYLQSVKSGYEVPVSLQTATGEDNQKWLIEYVSSEDRSGYWYKYHYYTIKSVEHELYLTMRNGALILTERDEENDCQLWNFFDLYYGWGVTDQYSGDTKYQYQYSIINKGASVALITTSLKIDFKQANSPNGYASGNAGYSWRLDGAKYDLGHAVGNNDASKLVQSVEATLESYTLAVYIEATGTAHKGLYDVQTDAASATEWIFTPTGEVEYTVGSKTYTDTVYTIRSSESGKYLMADYEVSEETVEYEFLTDYYTGEPSQLWILHNPYPTDPTVEYLNIRNLGYCYTEGEGYCDPAQICISSSGIYIAAPSNSGAGSKSWDLIGKTDLSESTGISGTFSASLQGRYPVLNIYEVLPEPPQAVTSLKPEIISSKAEDFSLTTVDSDNAYLWTIKLAFTENDVNYYTVCNEATGMYLTGYDTGVCLAPRDETQKKQGWRFVDCSTYGNQLAEWTNIYEIRCYGGLNAIHTMGASSGALGTDEIGYGSLYTAADAGGRGWTLSKNRTRVPLQDGMTCVINSYQWASSGNYYLADHGVSEISADEEITVAEGLSAQINASVSPANEILITYKSADEKTAIVGENGCVTGAAAGDTVVTVRAGIHTTDVKVKVSRFGDINLDEDVDIRDLVALKKHSVNGEFQSSVDDLNGSRTADSGDLTSMRKILIGADK